MRYTVVRNPKEESRHGLYTLTFESKRDLKKWIAEAGIDVNPNQSRAGRCIHVDKDGDDCLIFKGDPEALRVERTVGV